MTLVRIAALFWTVLLAIAAPRALSAQAVSTASKGAEIYAYGGYMPAIVDYGPRALNGYAAGVGFTVFPRFLLKPSLEVRADLANGKYAEEKTVLFGPRVQIDLRDRFHPYAEFLLGGGEILYHPDPYPNYTGDRSKVYAYGGGVDIDVSHHLSVRLDAQQRSWNLGSNETLASGDYTLAPRTFLVGVKYTVPFRKLNRQSDFHP